MKSSYSFLKDELALMEIRKHQWIESEKQNQEIGFATAAVEWIKKYGAAWKRFRLNLSAEQFDLEEKRHHRRFSVHFPIEVNLNKNFFKCQTRDINLVGLSCTLPASLPDDAPAEVTLLLTAKGKSRSRLQFKSRIARISKSPQRNGCDVFLPFSEEVRDYLRAHVELLNN